MLTRTIAVVVFALSFLALAMPARALAPDEQSFIDKHLPEIITTETKRLEDPAITKVFSAPVYEITVTIHIGDSTSEQKVTVARVDDKLLSISRPSSDADCPNMLKMVNPKFKLSTDADAKVLQTVFDTFYPSYSSDDKKAVAFRHAGHDWTFVRGEFFDKDMGFVVTVDDAGKITAIKFMLKLP